jgi:hypothetical protein
MPFALHPTKSVGPSINVSSGPGDSIDGTAQGNLITKPPIAIGSEEFIQSAIHGIRGLCSESPRNANSTIEKPGIFHLNTNNRFVAT